MGLGGRTVVALSGPSLIILAAGRARRYGGVKQLAPIGKHGEGVIDLLASDAWASGFEDIVIVVNPDTGPQIEEHVAARWPKEHKVNFAVQSRLRGTVDAVLAAESSLDLSKPFGVSNADDLYGRAAFLLLGERLSQSPHNCLVGFELDHPVIDEASRQANFSNEVGGDGTIRFLRNVMGFWMLQECERTWAASGAPRDLCKLLAEAANCTAFRSLVDTADPDFAQPGNMPSRVRAACARTGEPVPDSDAAVVRCVVDSMALAIAETLETAERCAQRQASVVHVVGGGSANDLFLALVAAATGLEVVAGPVEASAIGNLLIQLRTAGLVGDRKEMRALVAGSFPMKRVPPAPGLCHQAKEARRRLAEVAASRI